MGIGEKFRLFNPDFCILQRIFIPLTVCTSNQLEPMFVSHLTAPLEFGFDGRIHDSV